MLEGKVKHLRQQGKGKRTDAANALTAEEEEMPWTEKSLGNSTPRVLSQTMWWLLTQHVGLRGLQEHQSMEAEDFSICVDDFGTEYIALNVAPYSFMTVRALMMRIVVICARSHEIVGFS